MRPIVIEGADLVGKTTLCLALRKRLSYNYGACGPPHKKWTAAQYTTFLHKMVVYDRSYPSSYVYDRVRNKPFLHCQVRDLEHLCHLKSQAAPHVLVCVLALDHVLRERYEKRGDDEFSICSILKANELFASLASLDFFDFTYTCTSVDDYPDERFIKEIEARAKT